MASKKLTADEAVIRFITEMEWKEQDGQWLGKLSENLHRKDYLKVNKFLDYLGGSWNRKLKAHLFQESPFDKIDELVSSGSLTVENFGYFPTPLAVAAAAFDVLEENISINYCPDKVLEPSAGNGRLVIYADDRFDIPPSRFDVCEIQPHLRNKLNELGVNIVGEDFMEYSAEPIYDLVLMNPPFELRQAPKHILHAYGMLREGGDLVSIVPSNIMQTLTKATADLSDIFYEYGHMVDLPEQSFKESGTLINTAVLYLNK